MPFVAFVGADGPGPDERARLRERLCPYTEEPTRRHAGPELEVWATGALTSGDGGLARLAGTSGVFVRWNDRHPGDALVGTDPLGTCPLWIAARGGGWVVSPEAKALAVLAPVTPRPDAELLAGGPRPGDWSPFADVRRVPPGAVLRLTHGCARSQEGPRRAFDPGGHGPRGARTRLGAGLEASLPPDASAVTGAFVSGGVDSSIAAALARRQGPVHGFSLGTDHGDEFDGARALTDALDCAHHEVHLGADELLPRLDEVVFQHEVFDGLTAEILVQVSALADAAAAAGCTRAVTGYGSDLLFDGMLRHAAYMEAVGLSSTVELIERTRWTGEVAPFVGWARGLALHHVFWDRDVIEAALAVPREDCFVDGVEKHALRQLAVDRGWLPRELAFTPKVGLSDGTGAARALAVALGIDGVHAYAAKTRHVLERWKRLFA